VALFAERARRAQPDFALTDERASVVAEICRRLDGLPLAIELAAARLRIFTPEALLNRLVGAHGGAPLQVLTGGARDLPARQRTLRDTIAWSHDLLTMDEQVVFRRLAVFAGGCTLEGAEDVADPGADGAGATRGQRPSVLDLLASLTEQSLLRQTEAAGEPRYHMFETIREFADERLRASTEADAVRDAHLAFVRGLVERGEEELRGAGRLAWLNQIAREHDNVRAALDWSLTDPRRAEEGLAIAVGMYWHWHLRGFHSEARRWLERLLAAAPNAPPGLRAHALANLGVHARFQTDLATGQSLMEKSIALCREIGERRVLVWALCWVSQITLDGETARAYAEEGIAICEELGDDWQLALAQAQKGQAARRLGDTETERAAMQASIALQERLGDRWTPAPIYGQLARIYYREGDYQTAHALLEECVARV
jgi:hypothetical protein